MKIVPLSANTYRKFSFCGLNKVFQNT